ncbi:MAG: glycoside hydrolase family 3 protein [Pelagibacteraceae bacterium]|nr:glycoside hydrolase family 3 protein [Pelagibacteraceae bacterium]
MNNRKAFIVGIKSLIITEQEKSFLKKYRPWGVILFSRNIKTINQTKKLTDIIKKIFNDKNYPILIDQEGGRVNRLKNIILFDNLTSEFYGNLYQSNKKEFFAYYQLFVDKTSHLLKNIGVNINSVPVLDLRYKGASGVIGDRSFSKNKKIVSRLGDVCINLFHKNSIGTVMKHIPGHGLAKVDSHNFTPIINKSLKFLTKNDFYTFENKKSFFAMTAHVIYKNLDPINTVTHSKLLISFIRNKIGFKNILISDDLSMKSLKDNIKTNTTKAFEAGCNIVLHCNANLKEMEIIANNSPLIDSFIIKKTSQFYNILS